MLRADHVAMLIGEIEIIHRRTLGNRPGNAVVIADRRGGSDPGSFLPFAGLFGVQKLRCFDRGARGEAGPGGECASTDKLKRERRTKRIPPTSASAAQAPSPAISHRAFPASAGSPYTSARGET